MNQLNPQRALFQTTEELIAFCEVMVWAFVVGVVMLVFGGLVFMMLYSVTFVQQPIKTMAPIDMAYTKMLNDIVLLMTGSITTLIGMRVAKKASEMIANKVAPTLVPPSTTPPSPQPQAVAPSISPAPTAQSGTPDWNFMGYKNPDLDESWVPPPPPTTAADHLHPEREEIANERAAAKDET